MLNIILNCTVFSPRESFLLEQRPLGFDIIDNALSCITRTFPDARLFAVANTDKVREALRPTPCRTFFFEGLRQPGRFCWSSVLGCLDRLNGALGLRSMKGILVVSPGLGVLSPSRIKAMRQASLADPARVYVSASRISHNCHPSWLYECPAGDGGASFCSDSGLPFFDRRRYLAEEVHAFFPKGNEVSGSQWLPLISMADATIVCIAAIPQGVGGLPGPEEWTLVPCEADDVEFLPYRLPVFQMSPDTVMDL
jgi:hypothetical protein